MLAAAVPTHLLAQQLTTQAPPASGQTTPLPQAPGYPQTYPDAIVVNPPANPDSPIIESATQTYRAGVFTLSGNVVITAGSGREARRVEADSIVYDSNSGDLTLTGHVVVTAALNNERIVASHGTYNLKSQIGTLFDVTGSVGVKPSSSSKRIVYTTANPFLFTGRRIVKSGPRTYDIYDGSVTSCLLPKPDWILTAAHFSLAGDQVRAHNSLFRLLNIPVFYLPYVTHATDSESRQAGFLIPTIGQSGTRGLVLGEQIYTPLGRSADLIVGAEYYSMIGFEQNASFRFHGRNLDFLTLRYTGVLDRRIGTANQGGEDLLLAGRRDFTPNTRAAANVEYLSSYVYREAFSNEFNQAVTSDILSTAYVSTHRDGFEFAGMADRYQGIKLIAQGTTPQQQVRIFHAPALSVSSADHHIGIPGLLFSLESSADGLKRTQPNFATGGIVERFDIHPRLALPLHPGGWSIVPSFDVRETVYSRSRVNPALGQAPQESLAALARSSYNFELALRPPVLTRTFSPPPAIARLFGDEVRHTLEPEITYRRTAGVANFANILRFDETDVQSNTDEVEYGLTQRLFRRSHRTKPCRTAADFASGLNPEGTGSATNPDSQLERSAGAGSPSVAMDTRTNSVVSADAAPGTQAQAQAQTQAQPQGQGQLGGFSPSRSPRAAQTNCQSEELISWRLTQRYFFDPTFGNAVVNGRRNIFSTTLDLSGIAFLTEPRNISPLISRVRVRTSASTDVEWDFDLDTGAKKFTSSNVFVDVHRGNAFTALSYARLDAPGRFYTEGVSTSSIPATGVTSAVSDFNQLRYLVGYGSPSKPGLSIAANTGIDLKALYGATSTTTTRTGVISSTTVYPALFQYAAAQASYNWNCCGVAFEYRKFNLGTIHNEPGYRFNFTLANIGTAGNLRRAERLF